MVIKNCGINLRKNISIILKSNEKEIEINFNSNDLKSHLDNRDNVFSEKFGPHLKDNLDNLISDLSNRQNHNKPEKLIDKACNALNEVKTEASSFKTKNTQDQLKAVAKRVSELLHKNNPLAMLELSLNWLKNVEEKVGGDDNDKQLETITKINSLSHKIKKDLGG